MRLRDFEDRTVVSWASTGWNAGRNVSRMLEDLRMDSWRPVTILLSPFDNLICDRARAELLFGFRYRTEFYVPKPKRRYGYYVMPILHGERLIGRADVGREPKSGRLVVKAMYPEPGAPKDAANDVRAAVESLSTFVRSEGVAYPKSHRCGRKHSFEISSPWAATSRTRYLGMAQTAKPRFSR